MTDQPLSIAITCEPADDVALRSHAMALSQQLGLPVVDANAADAIELILAVTPARLLLHWADPQEQQQAMKRKKSGRDAGLVRGQPIFADWASLHVAFGAGVSLKQPIAKAVGLKSIHPPGPKVIDATAGWGEDAWLMASLGCSVTMVERSALLAAMLQDAVDRAARHSPQTAGRLRVVHADAIDHLATPGLDAQVIHLDPMFPGGTAANQRKPLRLLRRLVGEDGDADRLFAAALATNAARVVVKRPPHAPPIDGRKPSAVAQGKASRYDIYLRP